MDVRGRKCYGHHTEVFLTFTMTYALSDTVNRLAYFAPTDQSFCTVSTIDSCISAVKYTSDVYLDERYAPFVFQEKFI